MTLSSYHPSIVCHSPGRIRACVHQCTRVQRLRLLVGRRWDDGAGLELLYRQYRACLAQLKVNAHRLSGDPEYF